MKCQKVLWILLSLILLFFPFFTVYAEDFEFRVEPIFPESQIGNQGYYHFKGKPNDTVTLQARVINDSEKELKVTMRSLNAYSGNQGIIYQEGPILEGTVITNDDFQFKKVVTIPTELTLGPLESKVVEFTVKVPDINGTLLGSVEFRVFKGTEELTQKKENSQLLIDQYKALNIGVQVDVTDYKETPSLNLDNPHFSSEQIAIMIPMGNNHPVIASNISGTYKVTKSEDETFSITGEISTFKMAPMTTFHFPIQWSKGTLEPGTYHVTATLNVNGNTQLYEQTVSIANNELKETQDKMEERGELEIAPKTFPWITVFIALLIVIVVIFLLMIKKRSKPQRKDRKYPGQDHNEM